MLETAPRPVDVVPARRRRTSHGPIVLLALAYALLLAFPAELVLEGPLRSNGSPVRLMGLFSALLVLCGAVRWDVRLRPRPVAGLALGYFGLALFSWGAQQRRSLSTEGSAEVDRALLMTLSATGLILLCVLVVRTTDQANVLAGCLVGGAAVSAVVGMLQTVGVIGSWASIVALPFMTEVVAGTVTTERAGLNRVPGAAGHPIEYAVCLALVLPLAIHLATHARSRRGRTWALLATGTIMLGMPLGLSRSGLLAAAIALAVYAFFLPRRQRLVLVAAIGLAVALAVIAAPRVTGAFSDMITGASTDNSVTGRLDDYPIIIEQISRAPWLGGAPQDITVLHTVLDNQWLWTLSSTGLVGVLALAGLVIGAAVMAARASWRAAPGSPGRSLHGALAAGLIAVGAAMGTFDLMSFQQATMLLFLLVALIGVQDADQSAVPSEPSAGTAVRP